DPDDLDPGSVNDGEDPGPGSTDPGPGAPGDAGTPPLDSGSDLGGADGDGSAPIGGDNGTGEVSDDLTNAGAGLPPLNSIPGALMFGGLAAAGVLGMWLRRIGAAALGGAGSCSHGLDTGLPDLRKA